MGPTERALIERSQAEGFAPSTADAESSAGPHERMGFRGFAQTLTTKTSAADLNSHQLADRWGWLNVGRAAICGVGALLGTWAVANEDLSFFE